MAHRPKQLTNIPKLLTVIRLIASSLADGISAERCTPASYRKYKRHIK